MKLAIVGSRHFNDYELLKKEADKFNAQEIVSGGARGADTLAEKYAKEKDLELTVFLPKFKTDDDIPYHPKYFQMRNREIVERADHILAFMAEDSKGTRHTVNYAKKKDKPVTVINI